MRGSSEESREEGVGGGGLRSVNEWLMMSTHSGGTEFRGVLGAGLRQTHVCVDISALA